jgi:tetratricopeptide (TPR) repeat protein/tRNA A-37 threonylcarbamoyl transferase component Bud32
MTISLPTINSRYQLVATLGQGGMGEVYFAFDRLYQEDVALKRVHRHIPSDTFNTVTDNVQRIQLANEFRLLASLHHPNIIRVLDYGFDKEDVPFYTMDLILGGKTILEAGAGQSFEEKARLLIQLLQAMQYLHRHHILHRDLKPSNILVIHGVVKVLDFGLATHKHEDVPSAGTIGYMAPEVLQERHATESSDIFSLGVLAYELFAETALYRQLPMNTMFAHILGVHPDLTILPIPESVQKIIGMALAKKPQDRPESVDQFLHLLNKALGHIKAIATNEIRESFLKSARFVGRQQELKVLFQAQQNAMSMQGSGWLIAGENGVGKSRLVGEIRTQALIDGMTVLTGMARENYAAPYQMWEEVLRALALSVELNNEEISLFNVVVGNLNTLLRREVNPVSLNSLKALLEKMSQAIVNTLKRQTRPILIVLEDLQWASEEGLQLLVYVVNIIADLPVLILATFRDDEFLFPSQSLRKMNLIRLKRFNTADIRELSKAIFGKADDEMVAFLKQQTEGNAFFLVEILRSLAERSGDLNNLNIYYLRSSLITEGIQHVADYRLSLVPEDAMPLLKLAAVIGRYLDLDLMRELAPNEDLDLWISDCTYTVLDIDEGRWRFMHDKVREALLLKIPYEERINLHSRIAILIEQTQPDDIQTAQQLAYHWGGANERVKEAYYSLRVANHNKQEFASSLAQRYYLQALEAFSTLIDEPVHHQGLIDTLIGLGMTSLLIGDPQETLSYLQYAEDLLKENPMPSMSEKQNLMHLYGLEGLAHYYGGDYKNSITRFDQQAHFAQQLDDSDGVILAKSYKARPLALQGYYKEALPLLENSLEMLERTQNIRDFLWTKTYIGWCKGMLGDAPAGHEILQDMIELAQEYQFNSAEGVVRLFAVSLYLQTGHYDEALENCELVLNITTQNNEALPMHLAYGFKAWAYIRIQRVKDARECFERYTELLQRFGGRLIFADWFASLQAQIELANNQPKLAIEILENALQLSENMGCMVGRAYAERTLAYIYAREGLRRTSQQYFVSALKTFQDHHLSYEVQKTHKAMLDLAPKA